MDRPLREVGFVYLVGAGPGNPDLITVAGLRALERADCILYDRLVDPRLLDRARSSAERIFVGKHAGGGRCTAQEAIHELLLDRARRGRCVVRLKGGDPLLFARGGEEAAMLRREGVPFAIIPGVTAALAASAAAGIPLSHRGIASAIAFITGHEDPTKSNLLDWQSLASFPGTLVIYMALSRLGTIAAELVARGRPPETPVALVEWAGVNRQRVVETTLGAAAGQTSFGLISPLLAIIGEVCRLRGQIEWFQQRPLFGRNIAVLRPSHQAEETVQQLEALGAHVLCQPAFEIGPPEDWEPVDRAIDQLATFNSVVFTSRNGVTFFLNRLLSLGHDCRRLGNCRIAAIGPGTADALRDYSLRADCIPDQYRSEALAAALSADGAGRRFLLVRADRGREVLGDQLTAAGAIVHTIVAYRQVEVAPSAEFLARLGVGRVDAVLLSSSGMATRFFGWLDDHLKNVVRERCMLVSISPVTSRTIEDAGFEVGAEATEYTLAGMVRALVRQRPSPLQLEPDFDPLPDDEAGRQDDQDVGHDLPAKEEAGRQIDEEHNSQKARNA